MKSIILIQMKFVIALQGVPKKVLIKKIYSGLLITLIQSFQTSLNPVSLYVLFDILPPEIIYQIWTPLDKSTTVFRSCISFGSL